MSQSLFSLNKNKYLYLQNKSVTISYMVLCMIREFLENTVTILKSVEGNESYTLDMRQQVIVMYKASVLKVRKLHKNLGHGNSASPIFLTLIMFAGQVEI